MLHTRRRLKRLYHAAEALINESKTKESKLEEERALDKAWPYISEMNNVDMDFVGGLYLAGIFFRQKGHCGLAAQLFRRCCSLRPKEQNLWVHFGACLHDIHEYDAAQQVWEMLKSRNPTDISALRNQAGTYLSQGKFLDALNTINQAIELNRNEIPAGYLAIKGMACLALERWTEGFENYRGLYGDQLVIRKYRKPYEPEWDGSLGKTVVIQGDQGLGDEIRFSSVLAEAAADCKELIFDCHPKLEAVMRRSFPNVSVHGTRKTKVAEWLDGKEIDASHHISGLGRFYRKRNEDFPRKPYLIPDEGKREAWRILLADLPRPLVGLAWTGGANATQRENRSFDLATFMPIIQEGGTFVDLSYHDSKPEVDYFNERSEHKIVRFDIDQSDYDYTLALVAELDLVITVPTTILHAAGAIGKPCFVFNPSYPFWEFGKRDDMIWYEPGLVRIFRGQIEEVRDAYLHWCGRATAAGLLGLAEFNHPAGQQARSDHASDTGAVANQAKGPHRVHF